jgi:YVTN family beta-propeller protein
MSELPTGTVTFLFTDIAGSTQLVRQLGPGYARLLGEHQRILREAFAAHGGREVDTQGDSFFVAFRRAKDAVAAAVDAQRDLAAHVWPDGADVRVRMGLHTGEPQVGQDRYVGLGVHKAARIGGAGHGGQVLLSRTTRELVEDELPTGVTIRDLGERRLKDIERPERLAQLVIEGLPSQFGRLNTLDVELARKRRRMYAGAALIGVFAAAVAIPVFALGRGGGGSPTVAPNSAAIVDPRSNRIVRSVAVGVRPDAVTGGEGSIWVANADDRTLSRIDPATASLQRTISLTATPTALADLGGAIWVVSGLRGTVAKVDTNVNQVVDTIDVSTLRTVPGGGVAAGADALWAVFGNSLVVKIDPGTSRVERTGVAGTFPFGIAVGYGAVWTANRGDNTVSRILPETATTVATTTAGREPSAIAVGEGAVWVADRADGTVTRIDPNSGATFTIVVGSAPTGIAVGAGAVWVGNSGDGTISRIDPGSRRVVATIAVGGRPTALTVAHGRVWVCVQAPA